MKKSEPLQESKGNHQTDCTKEVQQFLTLMAANQQKIYCYILSISPQISEADDIMQETMIIMWNKFRDFKSGTDFSAWGMKIALYRALNRRQKKANNMLFLDDDVMKLLSDDSAREMNQLEDRLEALKHCVQKLNQRDRLLIYLRYNQAEPVKNMAERVGRSCAAIYKALTRIHEQLMLCIHRKQLAESRNG